MTNHVAPSTRHAGRGTTRPPVLATSPTESAALPPPISAPDDPDTLTPEQMEAAAAFFEAAEAVNLDEVVPEPIRVPIKEYVEETVPPVSEGGTPMRRRRLRVRIADIETYVPLDIYDKMLASRKTLRAQTAQTQDKTEQNRLALNWMVKPVLDVWQLTEPDMQEATLRTGLSLSQVQGLFGRFFGREMRPQLSKAASVATGTSASA